jgi:hypothetical protein
MGVESAADLAVFFDLDDFGDAATYTPLVGSPSTVNGIFDEPQASRTVTEMMDVTIPAPQFVCRTSDVASAAEGDSITIRSVAYTVRVVMKDGTGVTTLMLEKS